MRFPKIKKIYIDGKRERGWKYDREKGPLEFRRTIPAGSKAEIYYRKERRKRGRADDSARAEQVILPEQAD